MTMILTLKPAIKGDWLRGGPLQTAELRTRTPADKWIRPVQPTDKIVCEKITATKGNFTQVKLAESIAEEKYWWVFSPYWSIPKEEKKSAPVGDDGLPTSVKLSVPYLSQLDNENNPHGSCNVSSMAMIMAFYGHPIHNAEGIQLEDQLYQLCLNRGLSRHSPQDLATLVKSFGYTDDFRHDTNWQAVKEHLAGGNPCVVHGWFSRSGHIIVITGFNEKGFIVNDPYGLWHWQQDGNHYYDTYTSGEGLTYPYSEMREVCGDTGDLWIHYVGR